MSSNGDPKSGLSWPDHDSGPTPPPEHSGRQRPADRETRKRLAFWDRVKILLLLVGSWLLLAWYTMVQFQGIMPFADAARLTARSQGWLLVLAALELVRQVHYLISEHWARYHRFWTDSVFNRFNARLGRMNDWNRFRIGRMLKWGFLLLLVTLVVAQTLGVSPIVALFPLPAVAFSALPFALRLAFYFFIIVIQFVGIFWFLSKGGVDVYFPDDIETRFRDVWGQDNVLSKIKENMVFLDDPESIETKGGYVPGGVLLWGPPGTGKTLIAEAVAGETGKPFVFVDPGAFINMFMGVGILKVKGLFRKLRKLAVRYGGVIVFFDEADSLGNRGQLAPGNWGGGPRHSDNLWSPTPSCNGLGFVSPHSASMLLAATLERSTEDERRGPVRERIIMGGMGGGGMGTLQALLTELSGLKKPRGFFNRVVRRSLGMRPKPPPRYR